MHGCTVTTSHYLAHTRLLVESFLEHHPGADFSVLMIEDSPRPHAGEERFQALTPADIGIDEQELARRTTMYSTQGLAASIKPHLLSALLERGNDTVLFLDADGCVYSDLSIIAELARSHSLVLSPHGLDPYPLWKVGSPEQIFLRAGVMNAGLLCVASGSERFLDWWGQRTARRCVFDEDRGLFMEQGWLTIAPTFFEHHILSDRGCNVAGWNLHNRDVEWDGSLPRIDGALLRHFHFAMSYDPDHPERLTASEYADWWPSLRERPGVARLSREYAERLIGHGYHEVRSAPPLFNKMPGGAPIEPWMRACYRQALLDAELAGEDEPPNPFTHGEQAFNDWLVPRAAEWLAERSTGLTPGSSQLDRGREDPYAAHELVSAMADAEELLGRIRELEETRDDAIGWAERVTADVARRDATIIELKTELERVNAVMADVWQSPSWRLTRPLRAVKARLSPPTR